MNKKEICIIIPIYKEVLNEFEIKSVQQCIKILSDYKIILVAPEGLNMNFYTANFPSINNFVFFDKEYFTNIAGYNRLMLSTTFYTAFYKFEYMLLYQTDCYVFRDELLDWASKGYDYIGSIWFENYHGNPNQGAKLWHAGNGGLSLRKIPTMIRVLSSKRSLNNLHELIFEKFKKNTSLSRLLKNLLLIPLNIFGFRNNLNYKANRYKLFEDVFFMEASLVYKKMKTPTVQDAILFSWDKYPKYLYDDLKQFPFACHAWYRNDYPYEGNQDFWIKHINID